MDTLGVLEGVFYGLLDGVMDTLGLFEGVFE
jgi:hypothetical protein